MWGLWLYLSASVGSGPGGRWGPGVCLLHSHGLLGGQSWKTKHSPYSDGNTEAQTGDGAGIWGQVPVGTIEERLLLWDWPGFALGTLAGPGGPLSLVGREALRTRRLGLRGGLGPAPHGLSVPP